MITINYVYSIDFYLDITVKQEDFSMGGYDFFIKKVTNSEELFKELQNDKYKNKWAFRGQFSDWYLETTLERACKCADLIGERDREYIEDSMIRQFKRLYDGQDKDVVQNDTLYCLSLMRHHGAPIRLIDFTYSIYIAAYFALEYAYDNRPKEKKRLMENKNNERACTVWCVNMNWVEEQGIRIIKSTEIKQEDLITQRSYLTKRDDTTFKPLYMENQYTFISFENPVLQHSRLHLQQGVFLCPGNINKTFEQNLKALNGWDQETAVVKIVCKADTQDLCDALEKCRRMNISRESLFPGLDGLAQAMKYHISFYRKLYDYYAKPLKIDP